MNEWKDLEARILSHARVQINSIFRMWRPHSGGNRRAGCPCRRDTAGSAAPEVVHPPDRRGRSRALSSIFIAVRLLAYGRTPTCLFECSLVAFDPKPNPVPVCSGKWRQVCVTAFVHASPEMARSSGITARLSARFRRVGVL